MNFRALFAFAAAFTALTGIYGAQAQNAQPAVADPSRAQQRFIQQDRPAVSRDSIITAPDESGAAKEIKGDVTFTLKAVQFENLTAFTADEMRETYAEYIGKKVSLATLNAIAAKVTAKYRNAGYILSRAVVPPQSVDGGTVKIRIVEGFVNKVRFEGASVDGSVLADYAEKITNAKPLDAATLERYLLLIEDLPGVSARAVIQPAAGVPGASDVVINLSEKRIDGDVTVDNRGSRFLGRYQGTKTFNVNNLFGFNERTQLRGLITGDAEELRYGQFRHEQQIGSEGTVVGFSASFTATNPGGNIANLDIEGRDAFYAIDLLHPFIRTRQENLFTRLTFDVRNVDVEIAGSDLYQDRIRALRASTSYDFVDSFSAINRIEGGVAKGFGIDDNTELNIRSRARGRTDFFKANLSASRLQPISGPFSAYASASGQWGAHSLLSAERFGVGGANAGSAYDPSELTGDSGVLGRLELQYSQSGEYELIPSYQFYTFYDYGKVWTRSPAAGELSQDSLASAGVGTRFSLLEVMEASLEVAAPLTKEISAEGSNDDDARVFFSLGYRY